MASLSALARAHSDAGPLDQAWLGSLVAQWQILADLSFADLVLWLPDATGAGFWAGAQVRPTTGPTAYLDDVVGNFLPRGEGTLVDFAWQEGKIVREGDPEWRADIPVRIEAIPVRRDHRQIAVIARSTNLQGVRTPSRLELSYLQTAAELSRMIASGGFPHLDHDGGDDLNSPRVGDGFIRLDRAGVISYASPNALSVYRKLGLVGDLADQHLRETTRELIQASRRGDETEFAAVLGGQVPASIEVGNGLATVVLRSIPLRPEGERSGGVVLLRDVTEVRRRERELITKDATIREIHHRVKNNLQTVAALLRLQSRRVEPGAGRDALDEAVRRVSSIAVVHELLSHSASEEVAFDDVVTQLLRSVSEIVSNDQVHIRARGTFGTLASAVATPLAMVVTELVQNAVEHGVRGGQPGQVEVRAQRHAGGLKLTVRDDGPGLPGAFSVTGSAHLGLSIVETLVGELGGEMRWGNRSGTGAEFVVEISQI